MVNIFEHNVLTSKFNLEIIETNENSEWNFIKHDAGWKMFNKLQMCKLIPNETRYETAILFGSFLEIL